MGTKIKWDDCWTDELADLYDQYFRIFGFGPGDYEEVLYEAMTYEEYVGYIKECLEKHLEIPDVVK